MTSAIRLDHLNKKIMISKSFAKAAMNPNSTAYQDLADVMAAHPNYKVNQRVIKTNPRKETYEGLTYEYMRDYIILSATPEEELAAVAEFDEMILISKCHARALRYPTIKRWFLAKFPEVAEFGVEAAYKALRAS
jgi:hypothetical protein